MAGSHTAAVQLDVLVTATVPIPHAYVFRPERGNRVTRLLSLVLPGGKMLRSPCLAYVIRHPRAGTILIDTGMHPDAGEDLRRDFGTRMALLFRGLRPADASFDQQLRGIGVEPSEVERVVMTHLHVDHTSGMRLLPNARFTCTREEWETATAGSAAGRGYVSHHLPDESRMDLVDFGSEGEPYGPFAAAIDLFGDGSVRLVSTPGHTPGHASLLLQVEGGRQVMVVGDAAYTLRSIREELLPLLTAGGERRYRQSLRELRTFLDDEREAILIPSHDPTAWHRLRDLSPAAERAPA